jgi:hypothetical protein
LLRAVQRLVTLAGDTYAGSFGHQEHPSMDGPILHRQFG